MARPRKTTTYTLTAADGGQRTVRRPDSRRTWGRLKQLPSGRWRASYTLAGKEYAAPTTFATKTDGDAWLTVQRAAVTAGTWTPETPGGRHVEQEKRAETHAKQTEKLGDYAARWIPTRRNRKGEPLRARTVGEYKRLIAGPLAELAKLPLDEIDRATVREWYAGQTASGKLTQAARAYGFLTSVLGTAADDRLIPENPCKVKGASSASTGKKVIPPTSAELAIIAATMPDWLRAAVTLAAWGPLRFGETFELRVKDVEIVGGDLWVSVTRAVTHVTGEGFVVGPPKSEAGERVLVLPGTLAKPVIDHLTAYDLWGTPEALLFPASSGGHLAQSTFTDHWYPAREAAGRPDLHWHGLRHHGATAYAKTGATLKEIMARVGHSTTAAALRYQHSTGRDAALAARMAELA